MSSRLGLEHGLPTIEDLFLERDVSPLVLCDWQIGIEVGKLGWNFVGSDTYYTTFDASVLRFQNRLLDVTDVQFAKKVENDIDATADQPQLDNGLYGFHLRRAETQSECESTAGSYFIDTDYGNPIYWDDGEFWDDGDFWDGGAGRLYVHLPDPGTSSNTQDPDDYDVVARLNVPLSNGPENEALLYPGINSSVSNGGFEDGLTSWLTSASAGVTVSAATDRPLKGSQSAKIENDGSTVNALGNVRRVVTTVAGKIYRFSGAYFISEDSEPTWRPWVGVLNAGSTDGLKQDGRFLAGSFTVHELAGERGRWHRFSYTYLAFAPSTLLVFYGWNGAGGDSPAGTIWYDDVRNDVVSRWESYSSRLVAETIPQISSGNAGVNFGSKITTNADLEMLNDDGAVYDLLSPPSAVAGVFRFLPLGGELTIDVGYESQHLGLLPREAFERIFYGTTNRIGRLNDNRASISAQDFKSVFEDPLPPHLATEDDFPDADPRNWGKPVPMLFGFKAHIIPVLLNKNATFDDRGDYSFNDPSFTATYSAAKTHQGTLVSLWAYTDAEQRSQENALKRVAALDLAFQQRGAFSALGDMVALEVLDAGALNTAGKSTGTKQNNAFDFKYDNPGPAVTVLEAFVDPGIYLPQATQTADSFIDQLESVIQAAGGSLVSVTYDQSTHKLSVSVSLPAALSILIKTGVNKAIGVYKLAGQDESVDGTGSTSYTAAGQIWQSPEDSEILACGATGYVDDSSGTWTGTASSLITRGVDIVRFVAAKVYGMNVTKAFDNDVLDAFRAKANNLAMYLDKQISGVKFLETIELSDFAEFIMDGGKISIRKLDDRTVDHVVEDIDILEGYSASMTTRETKSETELAFDVAIRRPTRRVRRPAGRLRGNRRGRLEREVYLTDDGVTGILAGQVADLTEDLAKFHTVPVKGKLMKARYADRVSLSRESGLGPPSGTICKLVRFKKDYLRRVVEATLLEE